MVNRDRRGTLHLPMGFALLCLSAFSFGTLGIMRHWRKLTERQLKLDRCVGETALDLKARMIAIEAANSRISALRASIAASVASSPAATAALKAALHAQALLQEGTRAGWEIRRAAWTARTDCGSRAFRRVLPALAWRRDPPDPIGEQPLRWETGAPREFWIQADEPPRRAAALVKGDANGISRWSARWAPPRGPGPH